MKWYECVIIGLLNATIINIATDYWMNNWQFWVIGLFSILLFAYVEMIVERRTNDRVYDDIMREFGENCVKCIMDKIEEEEA